MNQEKRNKLLGCLCGKAETIYKGVGTVHIILNKSFSCIAESITLWKEKKNNYKVSERVNHGTTN